MTRTGRLLDVGVRTLDVPSPLGAPVIATEHRMRAGPAAQVRLVVPGREVVPAAESTLGPVGVFVMGTSGVLHPRDSGPVPPKLVIRSRHPDQAGPRLLPQPRL